MTSPTAFGPASEPAEVTGRRKLGLVTTSSLESWSDHLAAPISRIVTGDARHTGLADDSVDLIVTSPPYWAKRDYGHDDQIGWEASPFAYIAAIMDCLDEWKRVLRRTGSIFLNVGDTYHKHSLAGIPAGIEYEAIKRGWRVRNRIIWAKTKGMPDPAKDRLVNRHEYIIHLTTRENYYYDLHGYSERYGNGSNPGDVWTINPERNMGRHLAPFPREIVSRAIALGAPPQVCGECGMPRRRVVERTAELDESRPQAKRAMELAKEHGLTPAHIRAIQATGVSDAGKALRVQNGTGRNSTEVQRLAAEAKAALGGYFREFTFAKKRTVGWTDCGHGSPARGVVLDPFMGTGTTLKVAVDMGYDAVGVDLVPLMDEPDITARQD
ncbi:DNA-methyltransferase [Leifsonia aquatica]|uniref:DNA-methyltransferase n=1 Tax=Leifsonia aquatica TaxID=144185 RepID=UPI0009DCE6FF|nr:site-specific DNA-methyltransferase [Leifsonia aquatica]